MENRTLTLPDGTKMPIIGYGINQFENQELSVKSLEVAFDSGYRHFNTAFINSDEKILGEAIADWIGNGLVERKDLFITTKLAVYSSPRKSVEIYVDLSLANLGVDYIDLYLVHFPHSCKCAEKDNCVINHMSLLSNDDFLTIWKGMEEMVTAGKVKNIGFANVNSERVSMVLNIAKIKPAVVQLEIHPYIQNIEQVKFCKENGITVLGYAPIDDDSSSTEKKETTSQNDPSVVNDEFIIRIAHKHSKTPGQIVLRHMMQRGIGPLSKTINHTRIKENFNIFDFELDDNDMKELVCLNKMGDSKVCQYVYKNQRLLGDANTNDICKNVRSQMLLRGFSFFYLMDLVSPEKNSTPFVNFMCFIPYVHYSGFIDTRNYNKMAGNTRARPSLPVGETSMPALGLGLYRPTDVQTLSIALKHGYRHFNTAFSYSIGELQRKTMAKWIEEKIVRREDIFFTADIHVGMSAYHISNAMVYSPFGDYVDLCLLHLPDYTKNITTAEKIFKTQHVQMTDTVLMAYWMKAEEILQAKKARLIGLANFSFEQINLIINHGRIKPNVVQIPFHPYFQNNKIIELCEQNQILVSSYLPLPESALYDYLSNRELDILITQDPLLQTIGAMHGKTPMQIALRYAFERNMTVTTTTGSEEQMIHNMQIFDFSLTEENMKMLRALDPPNNANESNNGN